MPAPSTFCDCIQLPKLYPDMFFVDIRAVTLLAGREGFQQRLPRISVAEIAPIFAKSILLRQYFACCSNTEFDEKKNYIYWNWDKIEIRSEAYKRWLWSFPDVEELDVSGIFFLNQNRRKQKQIYWPFSIVKYWICRAFSKLKLMINNIISNIIDLWNIVIFLTGY